MMALVGLEASLMPDRSCQDALRGAPRTSVPSRGLRGGRKVPKPSALQAIEGDTVWFSGPRGVGFGHLGMGVRGIHGQMASRRGTQMNTFQVAALLSLSVGSLAFGQQAVQWKMSDGGNGHWYAVDLSPLWWDAWNDRAALLGARLASITSSAEQLRVEALIGPMSNGGYPQLLWLGAVRRNCSWAWTSSEPWDFTYWSQGNPNGGCADAQLGIFVNQTLPQFNLGWDDCICPNNGEPTGAVLEWSADCNNDGIVDYGQCRDGSLPDYNGNNIPDCCETGTACVVGQYPVQWRVSEGGNGHWYGLMKNQSNTWDISRAKARAIGADLATVADANEQAIVFGLLREYLPLGGEAAFGMGGFAPEGQGGTIGWQWCDSSPWSYTNWGPTFPNNDGALRRFTWIRGDGYWDDYRDGDTVWPGLKGSVLEWSADCNNDGIVDKGQILRGQLADSDNDGIPNVCECVCDVFRDFNVNGIDLGILLGQWGPANQFTVTDFNDDGSVDGSDLGQLLAAWGPCPN